MHDPLGKPLAQTHDLSTANDDSEIPCEINRDSSCTHLRLQHLREHCIDGGKVSDKVLLQIMLKTADLLKRLPLPEVPHGEEGLIETLWLLLTSVIAVPLVCKLPGGSPVLGFLVSTTFLQYSLTNAKSRAYLPWLCFCDQLQSIFKTRQHCRGPPTDIEPRLESVSGSNQTSCTSLDCNSSRYIYSSIDPLQAGGAIIGPHALGIIQDVEGKATLCLIPSRMAK